VASPRPRGTSDRASRVGERVGEDEPSFGVRIDDLHGLTVQRLEDVRGPVGVAIGHVLGGTDDAVDLDVRSERADRRHGAEHRSRAAHLVLHVAHTGRRLDAQAAGVERQSLADENDFRLRALRDERHVDEPRRVNAALADRGVQEHPGFLQLLLVEDRDLSLPARAARRGIRELRKGSGAR
jgi:hypothetical protein